jgi:hypothetical protein
LSFGRLAPSFPEGVLRLWLQPKGEAAMTYKSRDSFSLLAERNRVVIIGETAGEEGQTTTEFLDDAPSADEWRRALAIIAEHVLLRMAGYMNKEDLAKEGCRFAWDRFQRISGATTAQRGH